MTEIDKKDLSEIDICDLFITPAIKGAGWDQLTQIRREVTLSPGPIVVRGNMSSRNKKKKFADYVLLKEAGVPIAIVEAKVNKHSVSHGMQQALGYADILDVPSAFSSNGDAFASHNKVPAAGEDIECELPLASLPAPDDLWRHYKKHRNIEDDEGILTIESPRVLKLTPFDQMGTPVEIINGVFGGKANYESALHEMESALFEQQSSA